MTKIKKKNKNSVNPFAIGDKQPRLSHTRFGKFKNKSSSIKHIDTYPAVEKILLQMFVVTDYYAPSHKKPWLLFSGRFIEFIFATLEKPDYSEKIGKILLDKPIFSPFETHQYLEIAVDEPGEQNKELFIDQKLISDNWNVIVGKSENENQISATDSKYKIESVPKYDVNLLHEVLNRYYTNLNIYRKKVYAGETLVRYMQRCVIMLLNAVGACENSSSISLQNIAMMEKFDIENLTISDNSYNMNIKPLINEAGSVVWKILHHPIVKLILGNKWRNLLNMEKINNSDPTEQKEFEFLDKLIITYAGISYLKDENSPKQYHPRKNLHEYMEYVDDDPDAFNNAINKRMKQKKPTLWFLNLQLFLRNAPSKEPETLRAFLEKMNWDNDKLRTVINAGKKIEKA